ncbi:MAG: CdvA-like protein [Zestosphaera sp.]
MAVGLDQIDKFVGQVIKDEYGRVLGKLMAIFSNVSGEVESLEIVINDALYENVPITRVKLTPDGPVVVHEWKVLALSTENKLDRVKRRLRATEELFRKGSIPAHAYEELKRRLDSESKMLKDEVGKVKELLRRRAGELEDMIIRLEKDLTNMQILYMSNEISDQAYKVASDVLRSNKAKALDEKRDVEKHLDLIAKLETEAGEIRPVSEAPTPASLVKQQADQVRVEQPIQVQVVDVS